MKKIAIIGAGPAGVSAALYAKRANFQVDVYDKRNSALIKGHLIENYYGFPSIDGKDLFELGLQQLKQLQITTYQEEVVGILLQNDNYLLQTNHQEKEYDAIIIATGTYRFTPSIKNVKEKEGKGVSYCAVCDGFFYRGKTVAVIGSGEYALHEANYLRHVAKEVFVFTNGKHFSFDSDLTVISEKIDSILGDEFVQGIQTTSGKKYAIEGIFIAEGNAGSIDFARKLGLLVNNNKLEVNQNMATNLPGIYACGDCVAGMPQIAKAVYEGALAATEAMKYLRSKKQG